MAPLNLPAQEGDRNNDFKALVYAQTLETVWEFVLDVEQIEVSRIPAAELAGIRAVFDREFRRFLDCNWQSVELMPEKYYRVYKETTLRTGSIWEGHIATNTALLSDLKSGSLSEEMFTAYGERVEAIERECKRTMGTSNEAFKAETTLLKYSKARQGQ
jgi:hypothetical protein